MELTYVLVDFENVQPQDLDLLRGEHHRVMIFRGPHQKKMDFDIAESLQPLGAKVTYVRSERHGKNALDFHIAFYMGRLLQEHEGNGSRESRAARFVIVSKDGGFGALLHHVDSLGYAVTQAPSIREALGLGSPEPVDAATAPGEEPASRSHKPPVANKPSPDGQRRRPDGVSAAEKAPPAKQPLTAKGAPAPKTPPAKTVAKKSPAPLRQTLDPDDRERVIEHLRVNGKNRPGTRKRLERHIGSVLGNDVAIEAVQGLVKELEGDGVIKVTGTKVEYKLPRRRK